jgi:predicted transcriptional regulator
MITNLALLLTFILAITTTILASVTPNAGYNALLPASYSATGSITQLSSTMITTAQITTALITQSYSSTQLTQVVQPIPGTHLYFVESYPKFYAYAALVSWSDFVGALIWRGRVRSVWGRSRFSYDTFRLLVRMRGAQTRMKLMQSLDEPKNKLQLANALGLDWKAIDKHVQMLERNGIIYPAMTAGTATFYELTEKGTRLLKLLEELGVDGTLPAGNA